MSTWDDVRIRGLHICSVNKSKSTYGDVIIQQQRPKTIMKLGFMRYYVENIKLGLPIFLRHDPVWCNVIFMGFLTMREIKCLPLTWREALVVTLQWISGYLTSIYERFKVPFWIIIIWTLLEQIDKTRLQTRFPRAKNTIVAINTFKTATMSCREHSLIVTVTHKQEITRENCKIRF